jgi:hypothetical protein
LRKMRGTKTQAETEKGKVAHVRWMN